LGDARKRAVDSPAPSAENKPFANPGRPADCHSGLSRYANGLLGIDPKAARITWTVFLVALLLATAYALRETIAVFVIALLFAYLLMPLVGFVERVTPRQVSPRIALAIVYLVLVGAIVTLALTLGSRLADEANSLAMQLPALVKNPTWMQRIPLPDWLEPARASIIQRVQEELSSGGEEILPYVKGLGGHLVSGAKYALYLVLIPILAFFFLKDGAAIRDEFVAALVEDRRRPVVDNILEDINLLLGQYIRALVLLSVASFAANSVFLAFTGAPYAVLLAGAVALGEFVPVVGPAAGGLIIVLVTSLSGYSHVLLYLLFWVLWRMVQDYVLSPYLMSKGVQLNPMLVLFGVLAGDQIAGVLGMFLSVPVLAILRVMFVRLRRVRTLDLVSPRGEL
jgi:predicted PurR-regulated permease PerM